MDRCLILGGGLSVENTLLRLRRLAEALETTPQELLTDPGEAPVQNAPKRHARLI